MSIVRTALLISSLTATAALAVFGIIRGIDASQRESVPQPAESLQASATEATPPVGVWAETLVNAYADNQAGADLKYLDKILRVEAIANVIEKDRSGRYYAGTEIMGGYMTHSSFGGVTHIGRTPPPSLLCYVQPEQQAALGAISKNQHIVVVGRCIGRRRDGIDRGVAGWDFVVELVDCTVAAEPRPK